MCCLVISLNSWAEIEGDKEIENLIEKEIEAKYTLPEEESKKKSKSKKRVEKSMIKIYSAGSKIHILKCKRTDLNDFRSNIIELATLFHPDGI